MWAQGRVGGGRIISDKEEAQNWGYKNIYGDVFSKILCAVGHDSSC